MKLTLTEIATALHAEVLNSQADTSVTNVQFDSRLIEAGSLFIPLVVENDGHNYVQNAVDNHAVATLWQIDHRESAPANIPAILVEDTLKAFQQLAIYYLNKVQPHVVAISGSNGKTTTKDFVAAIGAQKYKTVKTPKNYNNEIGVPTTILRMNEDTELLVIEFGMDRPGDLTYLSKLVKPDLAVLTMIGEAHIEFFKTRERIADGKMEIITGLKQDGKLIYNGDEPLLRERTAQHPNLDTVTFGLNYEDDLFATEIDMSPVQTTFVTNLGPTRFAIPMTGRYNVTNALAAIAVGRELNIPIEDIATALKEAEITENRTEWFDGKFGGKILSDVYNSNPTAAKEVLRFFAEVPTYGEHYAVLGDMLELGEAGPALHASLAEALDPKQIQHIYLVGDIMAALEAQLADIYPAGTVKRYTSDDKDALLADINANITRDDIIMLKGSHGIHLEDVLNALKED